MNQGEEGEEDVPAEADDQDHVTGFVQREDAHEHGVGEERGFLLGREGRCGGGGCWCAHGCACTGALRFGCLR